MFAAPQDSTSTATTSHITMRVLIFVFALVTLISAETSKAVEKRGIPELSYGLGYGGSDLGAIGSLSLGHGAIIGEPKIKSILIEKEVPIGIPRPYPVPVIKKVPIAIKVPVAIPVDRPIAVPVIKPYPVHIDRPVPYAVEKPVPYPVKVPVKIPVAIPQPYPVIKPYPVHVPIEKPIAIPQAVPIYVKSHEEYGQSYGYGHY